MKPIVIDDKLHTEVKILSAQTSERMHDIMNRYTRIGLWYDSLNDEAQQGVDEEVKKFLIDKEINGNNTGS